MIKSHCFSLTAMTIQDMIFKWQNTKNEQKLDLFKLSSCFEPTGKISYLHNEEVFVLPLFPYKTNKTQQIQVSLYKQIVQINIHREKNHVWCMWINFS